MPTLFIASNAVSSDMQGAHLARELKRLAPGIRLLGSGGPRMREAGVDVQVQSDHLACVGALASLRFFGDMRTALEKQKNLIRRERPDLAILLDNEGTFSEMLASFIQSEKIPIVHYFPPLVWLWGRWRARRIARNAHAIVSAFPNELEIYEQAGGRAFYFGHPLVDVVEQAKAIPARLPAAGTRTVALMPGSRVHEVEMLARSMIGAARILRQKYPDLRFVLPVAAPFVRPALEKEVARAGFEIELVHDCAYQTLRGCSAVMVAAGTATIELALLRLPMLAVYQLGPVTYQVVRRLVKTPFLAMPNILLGRRVVPELRQCEVTPEAMARETERLLEDLPLREQIFTALDEVRAKLGCPGVLSRVARFILEESAAIRAFRQMRPMLSTSPLTPRGLGRMAWLLTWLPLPVDMALWAVLERIAAAWALKSEKMPIIRRIGQMAPRGLRRASREKMALVLGPGVDVEGLQPLYEEEIGLGLIEPLFFAQHPLLARDLITIEGEPLLREALAGGRGAMFLLSHLGPMSCIPAAFCSRGYDITFTGTPMHRPYYEWQLRRMLAVGRARRGVIGDDLPRLASRTFTRNGIFTAFMDYSVMDRHSLVVPLGCAQTSLSLAPAIMALRHRVPLFFVRSERLALRRYRVTLEPMEIDESLSLRASAEDLTRRASARFNEDLQSRPAAWWVWDFAKIFPLDPSAAVPASPETSRAHA